MANSERPIHQISDPWPTRLVIDILLFNGYTPSDNKLYPMYVDKYDLRKIDQNIWGLGSARTEHRQLCVAQQGCIIKTVSGKFH